MRLPPTPTQLALQRFGPEAEALVRANLRQAGRYTSVLEAYRAVSGGLAEGLQVGAVAGCCRRPQCSSLLRNCRTGTAVVIEMGITTGQWMEAQRAVPGDTLTSLDMR